MSSRSSRSQADAAQRQQPKFRAFHDALAVSLSAFERAREWPDLIRCLQRVSKVLHKFSHIESVPMAVTVCKRLAQCLNPMLPGGVHLKTLELYRVIFERIGPSRLVLDLSLYSAGLFPLLSYASTRVRPVLIELLERFYLPLGKELIPCLGGLLMALLPGLEEQGELYARVLKLMNRVRDCTHPSLFMLALWRCLLQSPASRLAAVNYITVTIPTSPARLSEYLPVKREIAIEAIVGTVQDRNVLVQRGMLDILISHFPLQNSVFSRAETIRLLHLILPVILRRETSVNRRFHAWLLSCKTQDDSEDVALTEETLELLVEALLSQMTQLSLSVKDASQPFDLSRTLLERAELRQSTFLERINLSLINYAHYYNEMASAPDSVANEAPGVDLQQLSQHVLKAAQSYFNQVDLNRVWKSLLVSVEAEFEPVQRDLDSLNSVDADTDAVPPSPVVDADAAEEEEEPCARRIDVLALVDFALDFLPVHFEKGESSASSNIPLLVDTVLNGLYRLSWSGKAEPVTMSMRFLLKIMSRYPLPASSPSLEQRHANIEAFLRSFPLSLPNDLARGLPIFSVRHGVTLTDTDNVALQPQYDFDDGNLLSYAAFVAEPSTCASRSSSARRLSWTGIDASILDAVNWSLRLFTRLLLHDRAFDAYTRAFFYYVTNFCVADNPELACIGIETWTRLLAACQAHEQEHEEQESVVSRHECSVVAARLWRLLSVEFSDSHFRVSQLLYELQRLAPAACEAMVSDAVLHPASADYAEGYRRFATLFGLLGDIAPAASVFPNALMLMLDALEDRRPPVRLVARTWLRDSMPQLERVLEPLCRILLDPSTMRVTPMYCYVDEYDVRLVLYVFYKLNAVLLSDPDTFMAHVIGRPVNDVLLALVKRHQQRLLEDLNASAAESAELDMHEPKDYLDLLVFIALRFVQGVAAEAANVDFIDRNETVRASSIEFLKSVLSHIPASARHRRLAMLVARPVLAALSGSLHMHNSMMQVQLLALLKIALVESYRDGGDTRVSQSPLFTSTLLSGVQRAHREHYFHERASGAASQARQSLGDESPSALPHWIWFTVTMLPFLGDALSSVAFGAISVLCEEIQKPSASSPGNTTTSDTGLSLLLQGLCGVVHYCLIDASGACPATPSVPQQDTAGVLRFFGGMFASREGAAMPFDGDNRGTDVAAQEVSKAVAEMLPVVVEAVLHAFEISRRPLSVSMSTAVQTTSAPVSPFSSQEPTSPQLQDVAVRLTRERTLPSEMLHSKTSDDACTHDFVASAAINWEHHRRKLAEHVLHLLEPLMRRFPERMLRAFLHAWEKELTDAAAPVPEQRAADCAAADLQQPIWRACPRHQLIIELLNALQSATPDVVVGAIVPVAIAVIQSREAERDLGRRPTPSKHEMAPLAIHETAALHFLDAYLSQCVASDALGDCWSSLQKLVKEALQRSDHPFTFLWLLGMMQQFGQRSDISKLDAKAQKELRERMATLLNTVCLIAGRSLSFEVPDAELVPLPSIVSYNAASVSADGIDDDERPPLPKWLDANPQQPNNVVVLTALSANMSLIALRSLSNVLAVFLHNFWSAPDKATAVLSSNLPSVLLVLDNRAVSNLPYVRAAVSLLASFSVSKYKHTLRSWRGAWSQLLHEEFFKTDVEALAQWRFVVARIVAEEPSVLNELIGRVSSSAPSLLFSSHKSDVLLRARQLKRLSFLIHSGRLDQYSRHLPTILEKFVEALKLEDASALHVQVLFCIRVLVARVSAEHLTPIWPIVLMEIIRIFDESEEHELLLEACKFVDLAIVLLPSQFQLYQWMFVVDRAACFQVRREHSLEAQHNHNDADEKEADGDDMHTNEYRSFQPHLRVLASRLARLEDEAVVKRRPSLSELHAPLEENLRALRRPVLRRRRLLELQDLALFNVALSKVVSLSSVTPAPPDRAFVDRLLLSDFIEYGDEYPDDFDMPPVYMRDARSIHIQRSRPLRPPQSYSHS